MYPLTEIPCPKCQQKRLFVGNDSVIRCFHAGCDFQLDSSIFFLVHQDIPGVREYMKNSKVPEVLIKKPETPDFNMPFGDAILNRKIERLPGVILSPSMYNSLEPDDDDRKGMYWGSFTIASAIIIGFLWAAGTILEIPWQTFGFGFLFLGFIVARAVDILTTFLGLWFGGIETNPLSDPYDITRLVKLHVPQIVIVLISAYFLGKWTPWAGNGVLLWMIMMGIRAGLSNVTQPLSALFLPTSMGEVKGLFFINTAVCSVIICAAAYFVIPYFIH